MKARVALLPLALVFGTAAYVALHPGVAYADIQVGKGKPFEPLVTADYDIDPEHGGVSFEISHLQVSEVHGRFNKFSGKIHEDAQDVTKSTVEFTARIDSIDTAVSMRDAHLKQAEYFDAEKFPEMTFKSTKVAKAKGGYVVTGDLTIKGKTKSISIPFKHYGPISIAGMPEMGPRVGIVAEPFTIKRTEFGVGDASIMPDGMIGASDEVKIRISIEAIRTKK